MMITEAGYVKEISPELLQPIPGPTNTHLKSDRNNDYAMGYSNIFMELLERRSAPQNAAHLLPHLLPGMTLLDLGCGPGSITTGLAKAVHPGRTQRTSGEGRDKARGPAGASA